MNIPPYPMFLQVDRLVQCGWLVTHEKVLVSLWDVVWVQADVKGCLIHLRGGETFWVRQDIEPLYDQIKSFPTMILEPG